MTQQHPSPSCNGTSIANNSQGAATLPTIDLRALMPQGLSRIGIEHGQQMYYLSITQSGKLILTK